MTFFVLIRDRLKDYYLKVERVRCDDRHEQYKISGKSRFLIVENNRPLFRNKGLKRHRIDWKLIEGKVTNMSMYELLIETLMGAIE